MMDTTQQTVRPIARGNRMLTARGRELILRRRRQNKRDANGAERWELAKGYDMSAAAYLAAPNFTPVPKTGWRARAKAKAAS